MPKKILVVDDEKEVCAAIEALLLKEGYEVFKAYGGKEAMERVHEFAPDLMVLDIIMPDMDGFKVCEEIRRDPLYKNLPILMLTAKTMKEDKLQGYGLGADEYMVKPFKNLELTERIKLLLK